MTACDSKSVDRLIGASIRARRLELGLTQNELGHVLGLSYGQIQKYERATNRISIAALVDIARHLKVPVSYFFGRAAISDALPSGDAVADLHHFVATPEGLEIAQRLPTLSGEKRRTILALLRALHDRKDSGG